MLNIIVIILFNCTTEITCTMAETNKTNMYNSNFELKLRANSFEKDAKCKINLISKDVYNSTSDYPRFASTGTSSKNRHIYKAYMLYILDKYKVLQCGVTEKQIKKRTYQRSFQCIMHILKRCMILYRCIIYINIV